MNLDNKKIQNEHHRKSNSNYINYGLKRYRKYFDDMFKDIDDKIILDTDQRKAVLNNSNNLLVVAGAGTGKTTTIAAKVKYLVDIKHIPEDEILIIVFTNKSSDELKSIIRYGFKLNVEIRTFHSLGYSIIRKVRKNKSPIAIDDYKKNEIILEYIKMIYPNKSLLTDYIMAFNNYSIDRRKPFTKGFTENYLDYETFDDYFEDYKKRKCENNKKNISKKVDYLENLFYNFKSPMSLKGEHMKSICEARIANFLLKNGIEYKYEEPLDERVEEDYKVYKPDFVIDNDGVPIYIEFYGLSGYRKDKGISRFEKENYKDIRGKKRNYHKKMNDNYIELDYSKIMGTRTIMYLDDLKYQLEKYNVKFRSITDEEIYMMTLDYNQKYEMYGFIEKTTKLISFYKEFNDKYELREKVENYISTSNTKKEDIMQFNLFMKVYNYYEKYLKENNLIDFSDMIVEATKNIDKLDNINKYKYLIIDEYQDISIPRYFLANKFANKFNAKVVSVGDDWQSIYTFTGSRVDLVYKYNKLFPGADITFIRKTYRNSHELIISAGKFVMRNPE